MVRKKQKSIPVIPLILVVVVVAALYWFWQSRPGYDIEPGYSIVEQAFNGQESEVMVEVGGRIVRVLETHANRERYQEFVVRLPNGMSLLVIHDSRYADRVPLSINDEVTVRGDYMWSENGGTLRYTYRDSSPARRHGWVDHQGKRYQ